MLFRKLGWLWRRAEKERELEEELRFHLEEEASERTEMGTSEARLAARRELGNLTRVSEEVRAAWTWVWLEDLVQDLRYALRTMAANKSFHALAILSLALGIGANTAMFSFLDSLMLRSLPVRDPDSLATLSWRTNANESSGMNRHTDSFAAPGSGFGDSVFSYPAYEMLAKNGRVFESVFGYQNAGNLHVLIGNRADVASTEFVTGNYFQGLGVLSSAGRLLMPDDDRAAAPPAAVLSYAFARRRFGDPGAGAGQSIQINNHWFTVAGVAPPEFFGADPGLVPDVYIPFHANLLIGNDRFQKAAESFTDPNYEWVIPMGRLRPGVSRAQAETALRPQFAEWMRTVNTSRTRTDLPVLLVRDGRAGLTGLRQRYSRPLFVLLAVVGLILALACANIANLLLARATKRRREIAVRLSIGAGRWRIVRQLLTESVLLASVGGTLGILTAVWGIRSLTLLLANGRENFTLHAEIDWRVLMVVAGLSVVTGVLFGLAPALQATRVSVVPALKEVRAGGRERRATMGHALTVAQIAISLVILGAAGLFVRSLSRLESIPLGFNRESVLTFHLNALQAGHPASEVPAFYEDLRGRFAAIPGVRGASFSSLALLGGRSFTGVSAGGAKPKTSFIMPVGADFFATMQIPLSMGREIQSRDVSGSRLVAVVNQRFVKNNLGGKNPIGEFLEVPHDCPKCEIEIVGVCGDVLIGRDVRDKHGPAVFVPALPVFGSDEMVFELRTAGNPSTYERTVRELVREADARLPVSEIRTQRALVDETMGREVVFAQVCTGFALLALAIACVGLYGAMSYSVARRKGEIGIRMALGAARARVLWMVLREVMLLVAAGAVVSIPVAWMGTRLVKTFLYDTKADDPAALAVAAALLISTAGLAGYLPARSASRIDPMAALRHE